LTFLALSHVASRWGVLYLFFSKIHRYYRTSPEFAYDLRSTRLWVFQRLVVYILVFSTSMILLISISLPISFPLCTQFANGTSGLGEFGSFDPAFWSQSLDFAQFIDDRTKVAEVDPVCSDSGCVSYRLSGGLKLVNFSWNHLTDPVPPFHHTANPLSALRMGQDNITTVISTFAAFFGNPIANLSGSEAYSAGLAVGLWFHGMRSETAKVDAATDITGSLLNTRYSAGSASQKGKRQITTNLQHLGAGMLNSVTTILQNVVNWPSYKTQAKSAFGEQPLVYTTEKGVVYR
jgi:hypothetical protein